MTSSDRYTLATTPDTIAVVQSGRHTRAEMITAFRVRDLKRISDAALAVGND